jgi:hypothetical protein
MARAHGAKRWSRQKESGAEIASRAASFTIG